jgi:arylsulfatase
MARQEREHPRAPIRPMRLAARAIVVPFLEMFKEFPPGQKAAGFTIDQALAKMCEAASGAGH